MLNTRTKDIKNNNKEKRKKTSLFMLKPRRVIFHPFVVRCIDSQLIIICTIAYCYALK